MLTTTYKLIQGDGVLVAQPILIQHYGRVGALLLQQIHYWSTKGQGVVHDHQRWIHNTLEQWADQLCVSASTVKRAVHKLVQDGVIRVRKLSPHKSDQTNSYAINLERLGELMSGGRMSERQMLDVRCRMLAREEESDEVCGKAHQVILTSPSGQSEPLVNQKLTYRDINKSTHAREGEILQDESTRDEALLQVENRDSPQGKNEISPVPSPRTTTVQDMLSIWNSEVSANKGDVSTKLNRAISKYLVACFKSKFNEDLHAWRHYCRLIAGSPYLMGKDFTLTLTWAVKYTTIDRILAGELGVGLRLVPEKVKSEEEGRAEALRHIDVVGESEGCKETRRAILRALGACQYNAWFTQVDVLDDGATLKPHNRFVEAAIAARFGDVLERGGR